MRNSFLFIIAFILGWYSLANFYLIWRTWLMLPSGTWVRWLLAAAILVLAVSYPVSRIAEHYGYTFWGNVGVWAGSYWIAAIVYLFLIFFVINLFDAAAWLLCKPGGWVERWFELRPVVWWAVVLFVTGLLAYGNWNATHPRIVQLDWKLPRWPAAAAPLRVVAISDLHSGTIIGRERVEKIVATINAQKPDLILLAGDTVDAELKPVVEQRIGVALQQLKASLGVYAVTGNHEFIGDAQQDVDYLQSYGIRFLRDEVVTVANSLVIAGREDVSVRRLKREGRASLENLLRGVDRSLPVLVLDHQPVALDEAEQVGADVQISGHTHDGQFWPITYIPRMIFKLSSGYAKFGSLNAYVSNGVGTWGPPVRIGNHPEILVITLH